MSYEDDQDDIADSAREISDLRERLNCAARMDSQRNREVQEILGYNGTQDPSQIYVPPTTLATRAIRAEAEVERLKGEVDKLNEALEYERSGREEEAGDTWHA